MARPLQCRSVGGGGGCHQPSQFRAERSKKRYDMGGRLLVREGDNARGVVCSILVSRISHTSLDSFSLSFRNLVSLGGTTNACVV
jgi:hypothetical protein